MHSHNIILRSITVYLSTMHYEAIEVEDETKEDLDEAKDQ
jgi:hypothetical protein